jgi:acyl-CoA thioesterase-1
MNLISRAKTLPADEDRRHDPSWAQMSAKIRDLTMRHLTQVSLRRIKCKRLRAVSSQVGQWIRSLLLVLALAMTALSPASAAKTLRIVAFGDSLTAGYGLPQGQDFAARLEAALKKRGHHVFVANAGVSGDTTAGGRARFDWAVPDNTDAVILELGANDVLRGIPPRTTRANLDDILARLKQRGIPVLLTGMRALANWGPDYAKAFEAIFPDLSRKYGTLYYPFFMEGVIDKPELKQEDALHPNRQGVETIVERILPDVEKLITRAHAKT